MKEKSMINVRTRKPKTLRAKKKRKKKEKICSRKKKGVYVVDRESEKKLYVETFFQKGAL